MEQYLGIVQGLSTYFVLCEREGVDTRDDIIEEFLNAIFLLRKDPKNGV